MKHGTLSQSRLIAAGLVLLMCIAMHICYVEILVPIYYFPEIQAGALPPGCWAAILFLMVLPALYLPTSIRRPSDVAAWILYLNIVVPALFMALILSDGNARQALSRATTATAALVLFEFLRKRPLIGAIKGIELRGLFELILPCTMLILAFGVWYLADFRIDLSFANVYERRMEARDVVITGSLMAYAIGIMNGSLVPIGLVLGTYYRRPIFLLLTLLIVIAVFSFDGTKATILIPAALVAILPLLQTKRRATVWICTAASSLVLAAIAEFRLFDSDLLANFLVRRQFVFPGVLTHYYWDFFSSHPHVLMSDSLLSWLIQPRYETNVTRLMGGELFGNFDCNANANLWASGFAHFGYPGVFGVSVVAACLMWMVDRLADSGRFVMATVIAAQMAFIWTNGALHTSILSNGLAATLLFLFFFPTDSISRSLPVMETYPRHLRRKRPAAAH
jgi:hypothetical protein